MGLPSLAARVAPSLAVAALAVLLGAAEQDVTVTDPQQAVPGHIVATGSVTYSTTANGRGCTLQYWPSEASALLGTALSPATMDQLGACLGPLFAALLRDHPAMPELTLTLGDLTALTNRIDAALDTSPKWNRANGSPRTGSLPSVVTGMINGQDLAKELNEVVRPRGYDLRATSVRMVSTGPVALFNGHRLLTGISMLEFQARPIIGDK